MHVCMLMNEFGLHLLTTLLGLFVFVDSLKKAFVAAMKEKNVVDKVGLLLISRVSTWSEFKGHWKVPTEIIWVDLRKLT